MLDAEKYNCLSKKALVSKYKEMKKKEKESFNIIRRNKEPTPRTLACPKTPKL